jgi:pimeloyl-ACP methyl ester carboxylesterase
MGGYVALHLAAAHAARIASVATLGTKVVWDPALAAREAARLDPAVIRARVPRFADTLAERHAGAGGWEGVLARTADVLRALGERPLLAPERLAPAGELLVLPRTPHPRERVDVARLAGAVLELLA